MTTTESISSRNLSADKFSPANTLDANAKAILAFTGWVNNNKKSVYFGMMQQPFFSQLQSALLNLYPGKQQEIKTLITRVLQGIEKKSAVMKEQEGWSPLSWFMKRIIGELVGDSERQYHQRIEQHWNSRKEDVPIATVIRTFVQENKGSKRGYSRNSLPGGINYSISDNNGGFNTEENVIIVSLMSRLGFNYVLPSEKVHFLIECAASSPGGSTALLTPSQASEIPVLSLPAGRYTSTGSESSGYDKPWLFGVLRALNQFLGMPELSDEEPANHADGMASSDRRQESMFTVPEMQELLTGRLSLSFYESADYIARCLIRFIDVMAIKSCLFRFATDLGIQVDSYDELLVKVQEISSRITKIFINEASYLTSETMGRIAREAMDEAKKSVINPTKLTPEIVEPFVRKRIKVAEKKVFGETETAEQQLLTLIKGAVPDWLAVYVRESIDQFIDYPRTVYGKAEWIAANYLAPDGSVFGTSDIWPGYAQSDGLVRVYTYAFIDTPRLEGFGRSEKGNGFKFMFELIAIAPERKILIRSALTDIERFSAIRFREVTEGEDVDFDFAVYRNEGNDTSGRLAFMNGELPHRRIRFDDQLTFGKDEHSALRAIRHETGHALGLNHRDVLVGDALPSVMSHDVRFSEFQPTDKLTIQLIHGRNPDANRTQQLFREAQKIWLAPGSWAAQIALNAEGRLNEDYVVTGFIQGKSVLRLFSVSDRTAGLHRSIQMDALDARTWKIRFTDDSDQGKVVLIKGMEPLVFSDLQVEVFYADGAAYQLQSDNSTGLKWRGYSLQNGRWVAVTAPTALQKQREPGVLLVDAIAGFQGSSSADVHFSPLVAETCRGIIPCATPNFRE